MYDKRLRQFDALVDQCSGIERKGKTMPYTSDNGHMFSLLNKNGDFGMRFSKEVQEKYFKELDTSYLISHGAKMNGYVLIPDTLWETPEKLVNMLKESHDFVRSLPPK